jgi:hypothetical protein
MRCSGCCAGRTAAWTGSRDDLRVLVIEQLGDPGGVLIADDTGFIKKGTLAAGVPAAVLRDRRADGELPGRPRWSVARIGYAA